MIAMISVILEQIMEKYGIELFEKMVDMWKSGQRLDKTQITELLKDFPLRKYSEEG